MAELSLNTAQADLRSAYWTNARDAMLLADCATGRVVDANPAAEALTGYNINEIMGMELSRLFSAAEVHRVEEILRLGAQHNPAMEDFHLEQKDGGGMTVVLSTAATFDSPDQPLVFCILRDMGDLERQRHRLVTHQWALSAYAGAALALVRAQSSQRLLHEICEAITHESIYVLAWVGIAEEKEGKPVHIFAAAGQATGYLDDLHITWDEENPSGRGPTGRAIRSGQLQLMEDRETSPIYAPWRERAQRFGIFSTISIPLFVEGGWRGALMVYANHVRAFEPVAIGVFEHLAREIGHGLKALYQKEQLEAERIHRAHAQEKLTEAFSAIVTALVAAVEARDPYTAGHEGRVAEIACAIGRELGWDEERLTALRMASMVHDIGKISIPSRILVKPGRLSDEEFALIRSHPETGYNILKDIPFSWPIAEIMRQHHEKLDGTGYPLGLHADQILPEAKVLAVADIVEAMGSDRPYRQAISLDVVLAEIESHAGLQLDAEAVGACVRLFRERGFVLPGMARG
jgi:PAS domain S-box-containing protein